MGFKHEMRTLPHPNTFPPCNKSVVIDGPTLKNYAKKKRIPNHNNSDYHLDIQKEVLNFALRYGLVAQLDRATAF